MRTVIRWLILPAALAAIAPASAELYKWVDERGVTNYSNEPPPAATPAKNVARVENKVSVYTPDDSFMQAVKALRESNLLALTAPERERNPVARIGVPPQSGYEQCLLSGRLGCDDLYGASSYYPAYLPGVAVLPARVVRPTRFLAPRPTPYPVDTTRVSRGPQR